MAEYLSFEKLSEKIYSQFQGKSEVVFFLKGNLGTGKTTFVKHFLSQYFSISEEVVQSPTFLKLLEYSNKNSELFLHADLYRIESREEFQKLSFEIYEQFKFLFVEWPERFDEFSSLQELRSHYAWNEIYLLDFNSNFEVKMTVLNSLKFKEHSS